MIETPTINRATPFSAKDTLFLGVLSAAGFAVGLRGISRHGYMGQDFATHRELILSFPQSFSYSLTNPPGFYWFGSFIHNHVSSAHYLEAIALAFLIFNSWGLWIFFGFLWEAISAAQLRYAAAAFATFVPFRVIHSVVLAADAFTIPIFAVVALFTLRLFGNPRSLVSWSGLSLSLSAGMLFKYTFVGLLPPLALLLAVAIRRHLAKGERLLWSEIGILAVALPATVFLLQANECAKSNGDLARGQWLPRDAPSVMRWRDILTLNKSDLELLSAPEYLRGELYGPRKYSYMGLVHVSSFTDVLGCFQAPHGSVSTGWGDRTEERVTRDRSAFSQELQEWSARWCTGYSALAAAGTLLCVVLGALSLVLRRPVVADATVVVTALAVGFYSPVFFSLHRLLDPYAAGYWLPRLILPALLVFFSLGFVLVDAACRQLERRGATASPILRAFTGYTVVACLLFIGFLI